jgi:hypothetical protein
MKISGPRNGLLNPPMRYWSTQFALVTFRGEPQAGIRLLRAEEANGCGILSRVTDASHSLASNLGFATPAGLGEHDLLKASVTGPMVELGREMTIVFGVAGAGAGAGAGERAGTKAFG